MLAWVQDRLQKLGKAPREELGYRAAVLAVLALGVFLRLNGYLGHHISLWLDEALWAPRFVDLPLLKLGIRPVGFVWLTRALVSTFGATEVWFRFLPNAASLVSLALMPYVASRLLKNPWLRVLLLLLFAIHPALVDLSNEFKPYSFEVLVHLVPLVLVQRYKQTARVGYLYGLLAYLPVSFLLAYNMAFAFPGLLLWALLRSYRSDARRRLLVATVLSGALCAGAAGTIYKLALTRVTSEERTESYWGKKYDVFYRGADEQSRLNWTLGKYQDLTGLIGMRRDLWVDGKLPERAARELGALDRWGWTVLYGLGVVALWQRQRREVLALLLAPLFVLILANAVGKWPFGAFRTNLFTSAYLFVVPLVGLDFTLERWRKVGQGLAALVLVTCVLPGFAFGFDWHGHKRTWTRDHYQREIIEELFAYRTKQLAENPRLPRARLVLDLHTHKSHDYYIDTHPEFRAKYHDFFAKNFVVDEVGSNALVSKARQRLRQQEPVWVVASKGSSSEAIEDFASAKAHVLFRKRIHDQHLILLLDD